MGTHIQWTDETWNPVTGCTKVSAGCDNCYIERTPPFRMQHRKFDKPGVGGTTGVTMHPERLDQPLHWRKPRRVFVNSLSDLFHDAVTDEFISYIFDSMGSCPQHSFQILTKRPGRMRSLLTRWAAGDTAYRRPDGILDVSHLPMDAGPCETFGMPTRWPLPNVWLGVSVENADALYRIDALRQTPAAVRFLSCEPLLGPLRGLDLTGIDWVIVGGESGPGARPMHPDWVAAIRDRCIGAGVPFFFKQWGESRPLQRGDTFPDPRIVSVNRDETGWPSFQLRVGKKLAGRELDGRTWDEYPTAPVTAAVRGGS